MSSPPAAPSLPSQREWLSKRLSETRKKIEAAALRYGRARDAVNLLAVSKQQAVEIVRTAALLGQRDFGENYLQEALPKMERLAELKLCWHFIGQIQSNKTRAIAERFQWVHTVDRLKIAQRLSEQRPISLEPLNVCVQVKLAEEAGKGGAPANALVELCEEIAMLPRLRLRGLMCIPPPTDTFDEQSYYFKEVARLQGNLQSGGLLLDTLSMGMSGDLEAAIAAGSTLVRVGTGIFGERTHRDARRETRDASE